MITWRRFVWRAAQSTNPVFELLRQAINMVDEAPQLLSLKQLRKCATS
jgi:hypothetical protein